MNNEGECTKSKKLFVRYKDSKTFPIFTNGKKEFVLSSKQILRSGTAIGALVREAEYGQSKIDFIHKLTISLKEANETEYWINILKDTDYIEIKLFESLLDDCKQLLKLLITSIKTAKSNVQRATNNE
jgi:four helix bundle protein